MKNEDISSILYLVTFVTLVFSLIYLITLFPTYFSGFFFGIVSYSLLDAFNKKDL